MHYLDKQEAKVNIMYKLVDAGWQVFGYKRDESDSMTDYYSPASWSGVAAKNGYVLLVDVCKYNLSDSGREVRKYEYNKQTYVANSRIEKLTAMMNDEASTDNEKASCATLIEKEIEKANVEPSYTVIETYPTFAFANPKGASWHIEKDGQIIAKGNGVYATNTYDWENKEKSGTQQKEEKVNSLIKRIEKALSDCDALKPEIVKVPVKTIQVVEKEIAEVTESDIKEGFTIMMKVAYTNGKHKGSKYSYVREGVLSKLGKNNKPSKSFDKMWSPSTTRINEMLNKGHIAVIEFVEVIEYVEKTVFKKTARKQSVSGAPAIETTEVSVSDANNAVVKDVEVTKNEEKQGIEIRFSTKPDSNIIEQLKANGFRWSKRGFWYAKQSDRTIRFADSLQADDDMKDKSESVNITNSSMNDVNIDDLHLYTVSDELQSRLHSSSLFQVDYKNDSFNTFNEIQNTALNVLTQTDNEHIQYQIKKYLQSFKQRYYTQYIKILNHRANNPSWAVTGRGGMNISRYNKMQDRYGNMLNQFSEMKKEFDNRMVNFTSTIGRLERESIQREVDGISNIPDFEVCRKEITVSGYTETTRVYVYQDYMIAKSWGMYRVFKKGREIKTTLKTTSRLDEAKRYVVYLISKEPVNKEASYNNKDDERRISSKDEQKKPLSNQTIISKIDKQIDSLQKKIDGLSGDYLANTYKRQREAESREEKKDTLKVEVQILEHIKAKAEREELSQFDTSLLVSTFREDMRNRRKMKYEYDREVKYPEINPSFEGNNWYNLEVPKMQKRLNKAAIYNTDQYNDAVEKYNELIKQLEKPANPIEQQIKKLEREVKFSKIAGYFPTPKTIVERMIDLADLRDGESVLEPSAGHGAILDTVNEYAKTKGLQLNLSGLERNITLRQILGLKEYNIVGNDFEEYNPIELYDKVIMNPPFEKNQDVTHVMKAYDCLKAGGRIVAIMSPHCTFANDSKSTYFREWLSDKGYYEKLPEGSFKESGTGVNTIMVVIDRSDEFSSVTV